MELGGRQTGFGAAPRQAPVPMYPSTRGMAEPPAGLGSHYPIPAGQSASGPGRYWWAIALGAVVVLAGIGFGVWALAGRALEASGPRGQLVNGLDLSYQVPADWKTGPKDVADWPHKTTPDGFASSATLDCDGAPHARARIGVVLMFRGDGRELRGEDVVTQLGPDFAAQFYGMNATVKASPATTVEVDGVSTSKSVVAVRQTSGCGLQGQVVLLAVPYSLPSETGAKTVRLLVVQRDTAGGGTDAPPLVKDQGIKTLLTSIRINRK